MGYSAHYGFCIRGFQDKPEMKAFAKSVETHSFFTHDHGFHVGEGLMFKRKRKAPPHPIPELQLIMEMMDCVYDIKTHDEPLALVFGTMGYFTMGHYEVAESRIAELTTAFPRLVFWVDFDSDEYDERHIYQMMAGRFFVNRLQAMHGWGASALGAIRTSDIAMRAEHCFDRKYYDRFSSMRTIMKWEKAASPARGRCMVYFRCAGRAPAASELSADLASRLMPQANDKKDKRRSRGINVVIGGLRPLTEWVFRSMRRVNSVSLVAGTAIIRVNFTVGDFRGLWAGLVMVSASIPGLPFLFYLTTSSNDTYILEIVKGQVGADHLVAVADAGWTGTISPRVSQVDNLAKRILVETIS